MRWLQRHRPADGLQEGSATIWRRRPSLGRARGRVECRDNSTSRNEDDDITIDRHRTTEVAVAASGVPSAHAAHTERG